MLTLPEITNTIICGESALKFPLRYSPELQIIRDANGGRVADLRGWGRLQYHPDGEDATAKLQDAIGEWIVATLNREAERELKG